MASGTRFERNLRKNEHKSDIPAASRQLSLLYGEVYLSPTDLIGWTTLFRFRDTTPFATCRARLNTTTFRQGQCGCDKEDKELSL